MSARLGKFGSLADGFLAVVSSRVRNRGVTLVELLIVTVIISILGIIAVPSYRAFVMRSQRTEAKQALLRLAANQERFYLQYQTYSVDPVAVGFANGLSETGLYRIDISVADGQRFVATAQPAMNSSMQADADCRTFQIDQDSNRIAAPDPRGDCW